MISINATLIVQVVNLLILIWILNKILFKPILRIMEEREQKITESNAEMERLRVDAAEKAQAIEAQMKQARREASAKKDEVCSRASVEAQRIIDAAQAKADEHIASVMAEAQKQAAATRVSLDEFKQALVEMVFLKVMGRKV